jgi:hypothetical protein
MNKHRTIMTSITIALLWVSASERSGVAQQSSITPELRKKIDQAIQEAHAKARQAEIKANLAKLADRSDNANQYRYMILLRAMNLTPAEGVPVFTGLLANPSDIVKHGALMALREYGSKAEEAAPAIQKLFLERDRQAYVTEEAALALARTATAKREAADALRQRLAGKNLPDGIRLKIAAALGQIGPEARAALPELHELLKDPSTELRFAAYCAIGHIAATEQHSLAGLRSLHAIDWNEPMHGYPVFHAIQREGPRAAFMIPRLLGLLARKPATHLQALVIQSLGATRGGGDPDVVQPLLAGLASADPFLARLSADATDRLDTSLAHASRQFADALVNPNPAVRLHAAAALSRFGAPARVATGALLAVLRKADGNTNLYEVGACLEALKNIGPHADDPTATADSLVELLAERGQLYQGRPYFYVHYLRAYILVVLAQVGTPRSALPYILDELANYDNASHAHGFTAAAMAAGSLGAEGKAAVKPLLRALRAGFRDEPVSFARFLLHDGHDSSTRVEAIRALEKIGAAARESVPLLKALVEAQPPAGASQRQVFTLSQREAKKALQILEGS